MKKIYLTKTALFAAVLVALVVVACGLKITSIDVKSEVDTNEEFTMTLNLDKADAENYGNYNGLRLYFGVRIPESWSATELTAIDTNSGKTEEENNFAFEVSEGYAKVLEFCFPCNDGYKWVAFQSIGTHDVVCESGLKAFVKLKAGSEMGAYDVDVVAGGSQYVMPEDLLTPEGEVNINKVFGNDIEGNPAGFSNGMTATEFKPSEYIMSFGTISSQEIADRTAYFKSQNLTATVGDHTLPLAMEITNVYDKGPAKITVKQTTGISDVAEDNSVEVKAGVDCVNVAADGAVATVYNVSGRVLDVQTVDGEATLRAEKGVCIVEVVKNNKKIVKKVTVK